MNIDQLVRAWLGSARAESVKTLELRVGQIVRGAVLQMLADSEAIVSIGGVKVRARLEAPLQQGQSAWLQVMPDSGQGVVLKTVPPSQLPFADQTAADILGQLRLKDTAENRQLVQWMQNEGIPLTRSNVRLLLEMQRHAPANADRTAWLQAASTALSRQLPVTPQTVAALHQIMHGPPLSRMLDDLASRLQEALRTLPEQAPARAMLQRGAEVVASVRSALEGFSQASPSPGTAPSTAAASTANATPAGGAHALATPSSITEAGPPPSALSRPTASPSAAPNAATTDSAETANALTRSSADSAASSRPAAQQPASPAAGQTHASPSNAVSSAGSAAQRADSFAAAASTPGGASETVHTDGRLAAQQHSGGRTPEPPPMADAAKPWLHRFLKSLGVDTEALLAKPNVFPDARPDGGASSPAPLDNLKTWLLQSAAHEDTSPAIRESVQQLLQHVTGQQLLLSADRGTAFTHLTLVVPFSPQNGDPPATIHIQSRTNGKRGQLDSSNCRLLFDLSMRHLGDTLIQVDVFDRSVSMQVWNDHPLLPLWIQEARSQVAEALDRMGYRMVQWGCSPFPEMKAEHDAAPVPDAVPNTGRNPFLAPKPYKGVDVRV